MAGASVCGVCRALLTANDAIRSPGVCPYCGAETESDYDTSNPYSPPTADLGGAIADSAAGIPSSFAGKLAFSLNLFLGELWLISRLVLTIWLPGHLLVNYLIYHTADLDERRLQLLGQLSRLIEGVFGPIYIGGILSVLADRMNGRSSSYSDALRFGLENWGRLFGARFFAGLYVLLGLLAFIVPGIVLSIRYALLDPVVVLEGMGRAESRARSTELVRDNTLGICTGCALFFVVILLVSIGFSVLNREVAFFNSMWWATLFDSIVSVLSNIITCLLFVFFWEGHLLKPAPFSDRWAEAKPKADSHEL